MSESLAPKAAQNDDESSDPQVDSSERVASDVRASTHPPDSSGADDDWLDGCDTVPAPRGSLKPSKGPSAPPAATTAPEPEEAIVPVPIMNVAAAENPAPAASAPPPAAAGVETLPAPPEEPQSVENEAPSTSAQVVPIHSERRRDGNKKKKKKARPAAARPERNLPVAAQEPKPSEGASSAPWLLLVAVAGVAGLWLFSRPGSGEASPAEAPAPVVAQAPIVEAPAPQVEAPPQPVEAPSPIEAAVEPAPEPRAPEPEPPAEVVANVAPEPSPAPVVAPPSDDGLESSRVKAFTAVVEATKTARNCRHRGDTSGKVPVVVEFGNDGVVQRTSVKSTFSNPMTAQCITSKFKGLSIPSFPGAPILITAEVSLR